MVELPLMVGNVASHPRGRRPRGAESTGPRETSIRRGIETFLVVASEAAAEPGGLSVTAIAEQWRHACAPIPLREVGPSPVE